MAADNDSHRWWKLYHRCDVGEAAETKREVNRGPAIRLRSVNANYHVLMSTFSASRALQVLAFTFQGGFDSHPRLQILSCTKNSGAPGIPARPPNRLGRARRQSLHHNDSALAAKSAHTPPWSACRVRERLCPSRVPAPDCLQPLKGSAASKML